MLRYDEVAFACACSTTSVSRSSSAITSSPSREAPEWAPHDKGGGRGTEDDKARRPCAVRETVSYACCKTRCIEAVAVYHCLWRCILSLSMSEGG